MTVNPPSFGGSRYVLTFLDDHFRFATVAFLKNKDGVPKRVEQHKCLTENQHGVRMIALKTDNGGEYIGREFEDRLRDFGIAHKRGCPRCPEQNGRSECLNRTLLNVAMCMLIESGTPRTLWAEAINTACYVRNRSPTRALNFKIPLNLWEGRELTRGDFINLRVFGCRVWVHADATTKTDDRSEECAFLGYEEGTDKGIRVYSMRRGKILIRTHGIFEETVFPFKLIGGGRGNDAILPVPNSANHQWGAGASTSNSGTQVDLSPPLEGYDTIPVENACETSKQNADPTEEIDIIEDVEERVHGEANIGEEIDGIMTDGNELTLNDVLALNNDSPGDYHPNEIRIFRENRTFNLILLGGDNQPRNVKEALNGPNGTEWLKAMTEEKANLDNMYTTSCRDRPGRT